MAKLTGRYAQVVNKAGPIELVTREVPDPRAGEVRVRVQTCGVCHSDSATTGNTSAIRGKAGFAGFAPTKAAQRILAESIAREVGPKGVHVAYVMIDAVIDLEWTRQMFPNAPDEFFIKPAAIAEEVWHVAHQDRSAWSFNVELRPFRETW